MFRVFKVTKFVFCSVLLAAINCLWAETTETVWVANKLSLPFAPNQTWYVCQGYLSTLSGTHNDNYAFDLTRDPNGLGVSGCYGNVNYSAGESVFAPGPGIVTEYHRSNPSLKDMVCLNLDTGGSLLIGHVRPNSRVLGRVSRQQQIAVVAESSTGGNGVENGGYAHIHIQAYGNDDCTGSAQPFAGTYGFLGVPNLVNQQSLSAVPNYRNQYFGLGLSNLMVLQSLDDAGIHGGTCSESATANEVYVGNCSDRRKIHSGVRFENSPITQGDWVTSAKLLMQSDGPYTAIVVTDIRSHNHSNSPAFYSDTLPSARLNELTAPVVQWRISGQIGSNMVKTEETPDLRSLVQEIVNRGDWLRNDNHIGLILSATYGTTTSHRRFMAYERHPSQTDPAFSPARLVLTQFRTQDLNGNYKGNNHPVANAGEDIEYSGPNQQITLNGSNSVDPDGDQFSFNWKQTSGPLVRLYSAKTAAPYFMTEALTSNFTFELTVTDNGTGKLMSKDVVHVYYGCSLQC